MVGGVVMMTPPDGAVPVGLLPAGTSPSVGVVAGVAWFRLADAALLAEVGDVAGSLPPQAVAKRSKVESVATKGERRFVMFRVFTPGSVATLPGQQRIVRPARTGRSDLRAMSAEALAVG